jgi:hypothetical protein
MDESFGWMKFELVFLGSYGVNHNNCYCYFNDEKFQRIGIWMNFLESIVRSSLDSSNDNFHCIIVSKHF